MRRYLQLLPIAAMSVSTLLALPADRAISQYELRQWDRKNGLPSTVIQSMVQTRDGYLWLVTQEGLLRFDGVQFRAFTRRTHKQLRGGYGWTALVDREGTLWVAQSGGLFLHPKGKEIEVSLTRLDGLPITGEIMCMALAADDSIWLGTSSGAFRLKNRQIVESHVDNLPGQAVRALLIDRTGAVWFGTSKGASRWKDGQMTAFGSADGIDPHEVRALHQDRDGVIRVATVHGLFEMRGSKFQRHSTLTNLYTSAVLQDSDGTLWYGTAKGLFRESVRNGNVEIASGLRDSFVTCLYEDREHALWVGTGGGVSQLRETTFKPFGKAEGIHTDVAGALLQERSGAIWLATDSGAGRLQNGQMTWTDLPGENPSIIGMTEAKDGSIWFSTISGVCRKSKGSTVCYGIKDGLPHDVVMSVLPDDEGGVWVGTLGGGVAYMRDQQVRRVYNTKNSALTSDRIVAMHRARDGGILIGTVRGGAAKLEHGEIRPIITKRARQHDTVRAFLEEPDGGLWMATTGAGLLYRSPNGLGRYVKTDAILGTDNIQDLIDDRLGYLWIGTMNGIARIRRSELMKRVADPRYPLRADDVFGLGSGMRSPAVTDGEDSAMRDSSGKLWFALDEGFAQVDPKRIVRNTTVPHVIIEELTADGRRVRAGMKSLPPETQRVMFRYTATTLQSADRVRFRYKLEGFDRDWIDAGTTRTATYTNLPPGHYTFRVAAANADGVWNETGERRELERLPAFHETRSFPLLVGAALLLLGLIAHRLRTRHLEGQQRVLVKLVHERTEELEVANKTLERISLTDALTGVPNRRRFDEHLENEWSRAYREQSSVALLMMDVDYFKRFNDAYGHQSGDECLRRVATAIGRRVERAGDLTARYGGEEFVVVLPRCDVDGALAIAESIRKRVAAEALPHKGSDVAPHVTLSIGVAAMVPGHSIDRESLVAMADAALYDAKRLGRNRAAVMESYELTAAAA